MLKNVYTIKAFKGQSPGGNKNMLKTNSRKVREAVRAYVAEKTRGQDGAEVKGFEEAAAVIAGEWDSYKYPDLGRQSGRSLAEAFKAWASGLPNDLFDYIAEGDTVELVGGILGQTEAERSKYSDSQACDLLTYLIFREISKAAEIGF